MDGLIASLRTIAAAALRGTADTVRTIADELSPEDEFADDEDDEDEEPASAPAPGTGVFAVTTVSAKLGLGSRLRQCCR